jgi:hypothetical protein
MRIKEWIKENRKQLGKVFDLISWVLIAAEILLAACQFVYALNNNWDQNNVLYSAFWITEVLFFVAVSVKINLLWFNKK